jgi:uncharacterized membrane protein (DUF2068 family)
VPFDPRDPRDVVLRLIAAFKLAKGIVLLVAGLGVLRLVHRDLAEVVDAWSPRLHLDPDGRLTQALLLRAMDVEPRRVAVIGGGMLVYAGVLLTEGVGLLLRRRWAEYFTVIVTASFVPLELYELARHVTVTRLVVLAVNLAIVWYLIGRLRRERGVDA